jgi:ABC-type Fe3+/spermidine/putrescine transport system ATPase subunit
MDRILAAGEVAGPGARAEGMMSRPLVDVRLDSLSTSAGPAPYLDGISLHVRYGEFFTILGPPHSGKTAILRAVAGFLPLSQGRVLVDAEDIGRLSPRARGIGYVFHQGALWPHLTVREHVAFGLEQIALARAEIERRVGVVLTRLDLAAVADARPGALTLDGQRRLALARALAVEPRVLLLDEPLAHLDPIARKTLRLELARLHRDLAVTTICSTRDAADAMALSDRIAVVADGRLQQIGDPETLYRRPANRVVAEALGPANFLPVRVVEVRELGVVVETARGDRVPVAGVGAFRVGSRGLLVLRPETLSITEAAMARGPGIPGHVALRVFEGARYLYEIDIGAGDFIRVELPAGDMAIFRLGDRVRVEVSSDTVVLLPEEDP